MRNDGNSTGHWFFEEMLTGLTDREITAMISVMHASPSVPNSERIDIATAELSRRHKERARAAS